MFDEAYFLVRRDFEKRGSEEIISEAQKIIDRNTTRRRRSLRERGTLWFALGALCGAGLALLLFAIAL